MFKKFLCFSIAWMIMLSFKTVVNAATVLNGTCGNHLSWQYVYDIAEDYLGTVTIDGFGNMTNYKQFNHVPWYHLPKTKSGLTLDYDLDKVCISNGITSIGDYAFWSHSGSENGIVFVLPNGLSSIGKGAFSNCEISELSLPDSVSSIGEYAFGNTVLHCDITIPNNVKHLKKGTFWKANVSNIYLGDNITHIEAEAFYYCRGLGYIDLPNSLTYIGKNAFRGSRLGSITIPDNVKTIKSGVFQDSSLTSAVLGNGITRIEKETFCDCSNLSNVTISNSVTCIGENAFNGCDKPKYIYYDGTSAD